MPSIVKRALAPFASVARRLVGIAPLQKRLDAVGSAIQEIDRRAQAQSMQIEKQLVGLERQAEQIADAIAKVASPLAALEGVTASTQGQSMQLVGLERQAEQIADAIAKVASRLAALEGVTTSIQNQTSCLSGSVEQIADAIAKVASRLAAFEGVTTSIQNQTSCLSASVDQIRESVDGFRAVYLGSGRILVRFRHLPLVFIAEADDRIIVPRLILDGSYEPEVTTYMMQHVTPGSICVDVGANIGYHSCIMGALTRPGGKVLAFEADPLVCRLLHENVNVNWLEAIVEPQPRAVAEMSRPLTLHRIRSRSANTSISRLSEKELRAGGQEEADSFLADAVSLDEALSDRVAQVDFLKIDVEGMEPLVLRGASQTIAGNPGIRIMMEWSPAQLERAGSSATATLDIIESLGLRVQRLQLDGTPESATRAQMLESPYWNVLLIRK